MSVAIFVISDLHLGGADRFQMCSPAGQARLSAFIRWVTGQGAAGRTIHLVLAGDIVDFLAERPYASFTGDDQAAKAKLAPVLDRHRRPGTAAVFDALQAHLAAGHRLTLLLGNHDLELSLPGPRRLLTERLGRGFDFLYDEQALNIGPVLIEHGNRYDPWNQTPADELRRVREHLSRGEPTAGIRRPVIPGSELVAGLMNDIKQEHPFVDLLKPEDEGAIPLLAVIDPRRFLARLKDVRTYVRSAGVARAAVNRALAARLGAIELGGWPTLSGWLRRWRDDRENTSSGGGPDEAALRRALLLLGVPEQAAAPDPEDLSLSNAALGAALALDAGMAATEEERTRRLLDALQWFATQHRAAFAPDREEDQYRLPAETTARQGGFRVVVYGHTHLARRVALGGGAVYLNSGTWADLIRLPPSVFGADRDAADEDLRAFVRDLRGDAAPLRTLRPTFARIDCDDGGGVVLADVFIFRGPDNVVPLTEDPTWERAA